MSYDGIIEREAILSRARTLAGGRILEDVPDDVEHARVSNGDVKPYFVFVFSAPRVIDGGRSMTGGDKDTPHKMVFTGVAVAADRATAQKAGAELRKLLLDWAPNGTEASLIGGKGGYSDRNQYAKPTRFEDGSYFEVTINLAGSGDVAP